MFFRDIIGQEDSKRQFIAEAQQGKIAHAQLLCGPEGAGKLPLAIAFARYICCTDKGKADACGHCPSCIKFNKLAHPDLHFVFPVVKKRSDKEAVSDDYITEWRHLLSENPYFSFEHWLDALNAGNAQAMIYSAESNEILRKLNLKSSEGGYKVMIIWLPEKMNSTCSNKLLKLLEEPPSQTVFLLVSENPEAILPTILSRTQRINIPRIDEDCIAAALTKQYGLSKQDAAHIARLANGNFIKALESIHLGSERKLYLDLFIQLMRLAYQRKLKELKQWSEQVATIGRERQKSLLEYSQHMIRENFIYNFNIQELTYMSHEEETFSSRFAPFINGRNVIGIMGELAEAQRHIEQNVNSRMVFFDLALKVILLLKQ